MCGPSSAATSTSRRGHVRRDPGVGGVGVLLHQRPGAARRFVSGVDGHQAITMLHVYDDRVVNSVVPLAPAPEVSGYPSDVIAQVEALSHEERRDLLSRKDSPFNQDEEKGNAGREA